jgi:copper transport protein
MKTTRLTALGIAALIAQSALAHTELKSTVPADQSTVVAAPEKVELTFSEPVRLTALTIQQGHAEKQNLGPLPSEAAETLAVALPTGLAAGEYIVAWRALSEDTHVVSGEFKFAVGAATDAHAGHAAAPAAPHDHSAAPAAATNDGGAAH